MSETVAEILATEARKLSVATLTEPSEKSENGDALSTQNQPAVEGESNTDDRTEDESKYPKGARLFFICLSMALVLVALGLDISIVAVTIPALSDQWHSISQIAWYSTALRLVMCSFMFAFGKAYTLFSVKYLFLLSLAIFEIGNVICTFSQSSIMFIVGRAVCGFGVSGLSGGAFTIITHTFPLRQRALVGAFGALFETAAAVSAPLIGGALVTGWTWRACFGINIPLGLVGCITIFFFLKLDPNPNEKLPLKEKINQLDIWGTCVFVPFMVCLLLALQWGGAVYRWGDARIIVLLVLAGVLLGLFAIIEWKAGEKAALPFRILRKRSLPAGAFFAMCSNAVITIVEYYISIYFQSVRGDSAFRAGLYMLPIAVGMCIGAPLAGGFTTWTGYYFPTMYVSTIIMAVCTGVLTTLNPETKLVEILCMLALIGFSFGFGIQAPQVAAQTILKVSEVSIGIAIVQFGSQVGPVLYLAASGALFTNRLYAEVHQYSPSTNVASLNSLGVGNIRKTFSGQTLSDILFGFNKALVQTLYLPLALACVSILGAVLMDRVSVKKESENRKAKPAGNQDDNHDVEQSQVSSEKGADALVGNLNETHEAKQDTVTSGVHKT